jgi:hypothetical protein
LMPGLERMAILARQSSNHTIADIMVRYGAGSVNIDACRISTMDSLDGGDTTRGKRSALYGDRPYMHDEEHLDHRRKEAVGKVARAEKLGRFPANLLVIHGPDCSLAGIREVKTRTDTRPDVDAGRSSKVQWRYTPTSETKRGYGGADGVEKVPEWNCQSNCPVYLLDSQTGDLGHSFRTSRDHQSGMMGWQAGNTPGYQDSGGASRFFHQSKSRDELEIYLGLLVGGYDHVYWIGS